MSQGGKKKPSLLWEFFEKLPDGSGKYKKSECQKMDSVEFSESMISE